MIQAKCSSCKKMFTVRISLMGKKVQCKSCGARFVLGVSEPPKHIVENK